MVIKTFTAWGRGVKEFPPDSLNFLSENTRTRKFQNSNYEHGQGGRN